MLDRLDRPFTCRGRMDPLTLQTAVTDSAWVIGPVIGTAFILGARTESAHAWTMDALRGIPPAPAAPG